MKKMKKNNCKLPKKISENCLINNNNNNKVCNIYIKNLKKCLQRTNIIYYSNP